MQLSQREANSSLQSLEPPPLWEYLGQTTTKRLTRMLSHSQGVEANEETEPIHQMRVWSRRTRAALELLESLADGKALAELRREVKAVMRALGEARDLDVMLGRLRGRVEALPVSQRAGVEAFIERLGRQREKMQETVVKAVRHMERYDPVPRLEAILSAQASTDGRGAAKQGKQKSANAKKARNRDRQAPFFVHAAQMIGRRLEDLMEYQRYIADADNAYQLHQMRIAAKHLRYTLEIFEEPYQQYTSHGPSVSEAIDEVKSLQEHLGQIHDADVLVPQLTVHLVSLLEGGHGQEHDGEPVVGVHHVDFEACQGVLALCQQIRDERDRQYQRLLEQWLRLQERQFFCQLRTMLDSAAAEVALSRAPAAQPAQEVLNLSSPLYAVTVSVDRPNAKDGAPDHTQTGGDEESLTA